MTNKGVRRKKYKLGVNADEKKKVESWEYRHFALFTAEGHQERFEAGKKN